MTTTNDLKRLTHKTNLARASPLLYRPGDFWPRLMPKSDQLSHELAVAHDHRGHGRLLEAEAAYRALLLKHPRCPAVLHGLGLALHLQCKADAAVEFLRWAVMECPDCAELRSDLATALAAAGRHEESRRELVIALQFRPEREEDQFGVGMNLQRQDRFAESLDAFEIASPAHNRRD